MRDLPDASDEYCQSRSEICVEDRLVEPMYMTRQVGMAHGIGRSRCFKNVAQCNMLEKILAVSVHDLRGGEVQRDEKAAEEVR